MSEESRDRSVGDNLVQSYLDLGGSAEDCAWMRAPPKLGRSGKSIPNARGKSRGRWRWISQYFPSFSGVQTFYHHQSFYREGIRKFFPDGREELTVLNRSFPADDEKMSDVCAPPKLLLGNPSLTPSRFPSTFHISHEISLGKYLERCFDRT